MRKIFISFDLGLIYGGGGWILGFESLGGICVVVDIFYRVGGIMLVGMLDDC